MRVVSSSGNYFVVEIFEFVLLLHEPMQSWVMMLVEVLGCTTVFMYSNIAGSSASKDMIM